MRTSCSLYIMSFLHQTTTQSSTSVSQISLYIMSFLHQTTTLEYNALSVAQLYIMSFLHQTTTLIGYPPILAGCISCLSYIKPQLYNEQKSKPTRCISCLSYIKPQHTAVNASGQSCCISCLSYIKPQHEGTMSWTKAVVYHVFPTSNHNLSVLFYYISAHYTDSVA